MIVKSIFHDDETIAVEDWSKGVVCGGTGGNRRGRNAFDEAAHLKRLGTAQFIGEG
jgi:hypothetical protein